MPAHRGGGGARVRIVALGLGPIHLHDRLCVVRLAAGLSRREVAGILMSADWQSLTAFVLVLLTAAALLRRWLRRKRHGSCGGGGGCSSCGGASRRKH
ncbi:MAG: FeoB-associated Cys-rich membrane protein [Verrucomicrobia bacterium]|nr:MAG: FeoB-associated Cys-rich membrane protein [Verrucomicrobiota bacterium]